MKNTLIFIFTLMLFQNLSFAHAVKYEEFDFDLLDKVSEDCVSESESVDSLVKKLHKNHNSKNEKNFNDAKKKLEQCMAKADSELHKDDVKVSSF